LLKKFAYRSFGALSALYRLQVVISFWILGVFSNIHAQHNNHWFFGENAGLSFTTGVPENVLGSKLNSSEGCSAWSDERGQLLFYTDGVSVWDRNHHRMPNGSGLRGHSSSTMSALIVPQPGNPFRYYIFTAAAYEFIGEGIQYAVVDMRENNGLGDVVQESLQIAPRGSEKLAAIPNLSGDTYWIVAHRASRDNTSDSFMVWSLRDTGLHQQPRYIKAGADHNHRWSMTGYLIPSPDGRQLAEAIYNKIQVLNFNRRTGDIELKCILEEGGNNFYGIAFSPDGRRLYASRIGAGGVWQYDLTAANPALIQASAIKITPPNLGIGAMLLGPDGKLYLSQYGSGFLHVIENPNLPGLQCGFRKDAVSLNGNYVWWGLPAFAARKYLFNYEICLDGTATFSITGISTDSVTWEIADSSNAAFVLHRTTGKNVQYRFKSTGNYRVRAVFHGFSGKDTAVKFIRVQHTDFPLFPSRDTLVCPGDSLLLFTKTTFDQYRWPDSSTGTTFQVYQPGIYRLQTESNGCVYLDSIRVGQRNPPYVNTYTSLCSGDTLTAPLPQMDFYRRLADTLAEPVSRITESGLYYYRLRHGSCSYTDSMGVRFKERPIPNLGTDTILCHPHAFFLSPGAGFDSVRWSDGSRNHVLETRQGGIYSVEVYQEACAGRDSIRITRSFIPQPVFPDSMALCIGGSLLLDAGLDATWFDAPLPSRRAVSQPGWFKVRIANACGELDDSVLVYGVDCACYMQFPNSFTPNGDGLNDWFKPELQGCAFERFQLRVYNRWGQQVFESSDPERAWDGSYMGKSLQEGVYAYFVSGIDAWKKLHVHKGNVTLLR